MEELQAELQGMLEGTRKSGLDAQAVLVVERDDGRLGGFLEVTLHQTAEGCQTTPVGFLEGWWMDPDLRRKGHGSRMVRLAEEWAAAQGCREMASDTDEYRAVSVQAHHALGYLTTSVGKEIKFRKWISINRKPGGARS
jgi:aminoglycoside 6'-N-acetyltransferase I